MKSLMDGNLEHRIEINMIHLEGSVFDPVDNRLINLKLVEHKLARAVLIPKSGKTSHIGEELYEKQVIIHRGKFDPPLKSDLDILESARKRYCDSETKNFCDPYLINEIYFNEKEKKIENLLEQISILQNHGQNVMVSNFDRTYKLTEYIAQWTNNKIAVVFRATKIIEILENKRLASLDRLSRIFNERTRMYIYPVRAEKIPGENRKNLSKEIFSLSDYKPSELNHHLYKHLSSSEYIQELTDFNESLVLETPPPLLK